MTDEALETSGTAALAETSETSPEQNTAAHSYAGHTHHHDAPSLNPELRREIYVEAPASEVSKAFAKTTKRYARMARIPGFREGKVPDSLVRSRFAKELRQEVMEALVQERFRAAVDEQNLKPISQPQVTELNLLDGQPLRFRAEFEIAPEIDVTGYESVSVEKPTVTLEDAEFIGEMDRLLDSHATVEPVEQEGRVIVDSDWAEIRFTGKRRETDESVPPPEIEDRTDDVQGDDVLVEVGGKNTLPAFSEALRGKKAGEEFSVEVDYPKEFGDLRLAGQTVSYDVSVQAIKRKTYPDKDAEFAKQFGEYESWEAFENSVREDMSRRKQQAAEQEAKGKLVEALAERIQFPVPESFVQQQIDVRLERGLRALAQQGMPEEQMRQLDFVRLRDAQRDEAVNEVKASLLLDAIAAKANIEVKEDDVQRELMMMSIQSREPLETMRERLTNDGTIHRIREQMRRERTANHLYENIA